MTTLQSLTERFKSGNDIEVERIHITRKEFDALTTQQWLPISSAPKDGTVVLTWRKGWLRARMCMLNSGRWFYPFGAPVSDSESDEPTHWQPLPAPPTD